MIASIVLQGRSALSTRRWLQNVLLGQSAIHQRPSFAALVSLGRTRTSLEPQAACHALQVATVRREPRLLCLALLALV